MSKVSILLKPCRQLQAASTPAHKNASSSKSLAHSIVKSAQLLKAQLISQNYNRFNSKMKAIFLLLLVASVLSFEVQQSLSLSDLLQRKKTAVKTDIFGRQVKVVLQQKGSGITDAQLTFALKLMEQGASIYAEDLVGNAKFIASKIQDAWSGRWNVEIFGGDPSWGRSTHISQDKWVLFFAWGDYELDYIIWAPDC